MNVTQELKDLIKQSTKIDARILELLQIVQDEKLYLDRYGSLFDYCRKELGLSDSQSQRRIDALRAVKRHPKLKEAVQMGDITVTQAGLLGNLELQANNLGTDTKSIIDSIIEDSKGRTVMETELDTRTKLNLKTKKKKIVFEVSEQLFEQWRKVRSLKNYKNNDQILAELIAEELHRYENRSSHVRKYVQASRAPSPALRQMVMKRAGFKCEAPKCLNQVNLQIDHCLPYAKGGKTSLDNLRVLCRPHNLARNL